MIDQNELIKCGWCDKESTAKEWQDTTYNACYTRQQRRAFRELKDEKQLRDDQKTYYLCPKCGLWEQGCQTTLVREVDGKLRVYGGKPVVRIIRNRDIEN